MIIRSDAACFVGVDLHRDTLTACVINAATLWSDHRRLAEIEQDLGESKRRIGELIQVPGFARLRQILESIPGVGLVTSATAIAEIGDFSRFPDAKAIGRYAGLTPSGPAEPAAA